MKTRRIYLNPNEVVEVINPFGTSILKAISRFDEDHAVVVVYEQPGVAMLTPMDAEGIGLTREPISYKEIAPDNTEQMHMQPSFKFPHD
jgi:hypothetical protein